MWTLTINNKTGSLIFLKKLKNLKTIDWKKLSLLFLFKNLKAVNFKSRTNSRIQKIVFHDNCVETHPGLLAPAYAASILEGTNPALREFIDSENIITHYNKRLRKRFLRCFQ
jgi:hypothetical protein